MRTLDFAPLYRHTVGFDRLFDMLDATAARSEWPPYDIERKGENEYRICMAVAGFGQNDLELTQNGNVLLVSGQRQAPEKGRELLHRGIATRSFRQTFNLADHVRVTGAQLENGLLSIDLVREIPEQLKPRRIEIGSKSSIAPTQDNYPAQIDEGAERKVA